MNKKGGLELSMNTIVVIILSVVVMAFGFTLLSNIFSLQEELTDINTEAEFDFSGFVGIQQDSFKVFDDDVIVINFGISNKNTRFSGEKNFTVRLRQVIGLTDLNAQDGVATDNNDILDEISIHSSGNNRNLFVTDLDFGATSYKKFAIDNVGKVKEELDPNGAQGLEHFVFEFLVCPGEIACANYNSLSGKYHRVFVSLK